MKPELLSSISPQFRLDLLKAMANGSSGHLATSLAFVELLAALYLGAHQGKSFLTFDPSKPQSEDHDYVVLSMSEILPIATVVLARAGFKVDSVSTRFSSVKISGIDFCSDSPGHGLSIGEGLARSLLMDRKTNRVFVILGDSDLEQGSLWESAMSAGFSRFERLTVLCGHDPNFSKVEPLQEKWESFGWRVFKMVDGNDSHEWGSILGKLKTPSRRPTIVLAPIVLGKGIPFIEGKSEYNGVALSEREFQEAVHFLQIERF